MGHEYLHYYENFRYYYQKHVRSVRTKNINEMKRMFKKAVSGDKIQNTPEVRQKQHAEPSVAQS